MALADIFYVEGLKDYVKVYLVSATRPLLLLPNLRIRQFMRIHRSHLLGLNYIQAVDRGTVQIWGKTLPVSDDYCEASI